MERLNKDETRNSTSNKRTYYWFKCECGNIVSRRADSTAKHCSGPACPFSTFNRHGKSETRLYNIWSGMRDRCINGCHKSASTYKEHGITITKEWELFVNFENWALANGYKDTLTLDRIDITLGYSPDNCEWVTREENTRRQVKDYHSNQTPILLVHEETEKVIEFKSIADAGRYILVKGLSQTDKLKSITVSINKALRDKVVRYGYIFKYKEAKDAK